MTAASAVMEVPSSRRIRTPPSSSWPPSTEPCTTVTPRSAKALVRVAARARGNICSCTSSRSSTRVTCDAVLHEGGGDLRADVAAADDRDVAALGRDGAQPLVVGGGAVVDDPRAGVDGEHAGLGAGGEQQLAVADAAAVGEAYDVRAGVDLGHRGVGDQVDGVVLVEVAGERGALEGLVVLEPEVLGQDGPVDRLVGSEPRTAIATGLVLRTDALHGARRGDPRTDDDVVIGLLDVAHAAIVHPRWSARLRWSTGHEARSIRGCGAPPSRRRGSWRCRPGSGRRRRCGGAATRGRPCAGTS